MRPGSPDEDEASLQRVLAELPEEQSTRRRQPRSMSVRFDAPPAPSRVVPVAAEGRRSGSGGGRAAGRPAALEPSPDGRDPLLAANAEVAVSGSGSLVEDLYRENRIAWRQLDEKSRDLVASMQAHQQTEQNLRQVLAERQSLHGEVRLLQHRLAELEAQVEEERQRREAVEQELAEWRQRVEERQGQCFELEQRCRAADRRSEKLASELQASQKLREEANGRAQQEERAVAEALQRSKRTEEQWQLESEAREKQLQAQYAELGLKRQGEIKGALLELQALAQGQEKLRAELQRNYRPPTVQAAYAEPMWEMPDDPIELLRAHVSVHRHGGHHHPGRRNSLLSGKIGEMADFLERQCLQLEGRSQGIL